MPTLNIKPITHISPAKIARFWSYVTKAGPNECWIWRTCKEGNRPMFNALGHRGPGAYRIASRISFFLANGRDTPLYVLHKCDNPRCVNPEHLFEGTHQDNVTDKMQKNRHGCNPNPGHPGSCNGRAKLQEEQVSLIRQLHREGSSTRTLAYKFNVAVGTIRKIVASRSWKHINHSE